MFYWVLARVVLDVRVLASRGGATVAVTKRDVLLLVSVCLFGCKDANDTVLQPDTAAGSGGSAGRSAGVGGGGSGGMPQSGAAAGESGSQAGTGTASAGSGGVTPAAGSGGAAGNSTAAGAGAGEPAAGESGGTAGKGGAGAGTGGTSGAAGASGMAGGAAGSGGQAGSPGAQDPDCDFNGIWIANQLTVSEALSLPQTSNNWYYLELKQSGNAVEVSKHFDCGIEVHGSATVTVSRATLQGLLSHNVQTGRKATVTKQGTTCKFDGARFWSIRGGDEARFLPNATRDSGDSIRQVAAAKPLPKPGMTDGAVDTENDGKLGVAFQVAGIITGTRNSVQRDWTRWFTEPGFEIAATTTWKDLKIRADFDNEESILDPTTGLLVSTSAPKAGSKHTLKLRFLGRDSSDPRVSAIVKANQVDTCFAIQDALPAEALE